MATPTAKSPPTPTDPLEGFSASVRRVAGRLGGTTEVTPDRIVAELLGDHSDYGADPSFASRLPPVGEARGVDVWLARVRELFDPEALARSPSKVVDGRLTILALGRLAPVLGQILRTARLGTRLERGLGFRLASVLHPWAL